MGFVLIAGYLWFYATPWFLPITLAGPAMAAPPKKERELDSSEGRMVVPNVQPGPRPDHVRRLG